VNRSIDASPRASAPPDVGEPSRIRELACGLRGHSGGIGNPNRNGLETTSLPAGALASPLHPSAAKGAFRESAPLVQSSEGASAEGESKKLQRVHRSGRATTNGLATPGLFTGAKPPRRSDTRKGHGARGERTHSRNRHKRRAEWLISRTSF